MNRKEAAEKLMQFDVEKGFDKKDKPYNLLVKDGFAGERPIALWHSSRFEYFATAATPLAMLCRPDIDSAERLARGGKVNHGDASKPEKVSMARLVNKGFATRGDYEWKPTEKLMNAINCWCEAKECVR